MLTKVVHRKNCFFKILITLLLLTLLPLVAQAAGKTVRVGWYLVPGLHNYDPLHKKYSGYDYDYLKAVAQYTDWQYEFVVEPFADCIADLKTGQLDLIGGVAKNAAREKE